MEYIKQNLDFILTYIRDETESFQIFVDEKRNDVHIRYILLSNESNKSNEESIDRLKVLCKMLPIFNTYCSDSSKPTLKLIYKIDDLILKLTKKLVKEYKYPREDRSFEEKITVIEELDKIKLCYFSSIKNFFNQIVQFKKIKMKDL